MNPKGSSPSYGGGNMFSGDAYGGSGSNPLPGLSAGDYGATGGRVASYAEGGATDQPESSPFNLPPGFNDKPINVAEHSIIPTVQTPAIQAHVPQLNLSPPQQSGGGGGGPSVADVAKLAMMFINRGGRVPNNPYARGGVAGFAGGGTPSPLDEAQWPYGPEGGPSPLDTANWPSGPVGGPSDVVNPDEPYRMPDAAAVADWRQGADASMADGTGATPVAYKPAFPPPSGAHGRSVGAPAIETLEDAQQDVSARSRTPAAPAEAASARDTGFAGSPWAALMAAGLGIASGTSPFAAVNIGQGGMQGLKVLEAQRAASQKDETIDQATRRLDLEAKHHEDQYSRMTPYQKGQLDLAQTAATREEMKPVKIGVDLLGRDVMARRDPKTGQYINTMTGKPVDADSNTLQVPPQYKPLPGGGAEAEVDPAALPPHAWVTQGYNAPEGVNPEILAQLPPQRAATIRAIDEGRQSITSVPLRDRQSVIDQVNAYDPNFDQSVWTNRNQQQRDLSTNGNAGKMILAVNQLLPHLKTASDKAQALENSNFKGGNVITNWLRTETGDPRPGNFETVREVASMDAARLLRGSGAMAEKDIDFWRNNLATAGSPRQLQEKIDLLADDLMGARISSIQHSYRMNMRMEPPEFLSKEAKEALGVIKGRNAKPADGAAAAPSPAAPPAVTAPTAAAPPTAKPATVTQNGHTYVLQPDGSYK